jgi:hypothetical protein
MSVSIVHDKLVPTQLDFVTVLHLHDGRTDVTDANSSHNCHDDDDDDDDFWLRGKACWIYRFAKIL